MATDRMTPVVRVGVRKGRGSRPVRGCSTSQLLADPAYQDAGPWFTTGLKRPPGREFATIRLTVNRALVQAQAPVERGIARLKSWQISAGPGISPNRMNIIGKAVPTLERQR